jgi:hypothetical protein
LARSPRVIPLAAAVAFLSAAAALAHSGAPPAGRDTGIPIANVTHGQMQVLSDYDGAVLDLAARLYGADAAFRRVLNYAHVQKTWCAWGLMPGSVSDETSPFNACSHAYLAAVQDLLLRMSALPMRMRAVDELVRRVEMEMMENGAALQLCQYSDADFNTAATLTPDWGAVLRHPTSLASLAGMVLGLGGLSGAAARVLRRPASIA